MKYSSKPCLKLGLATLTAMLVTPAMVYAEAGDWVVRARAVVVAPNDDSKLGKAVNNLGLGQVMSPSAYLEPDVNVMPEVDISYYFTKNIAAELILALGSRHDVRVKGDSLTTIGNQNLGSVNLLPPTLTLQWHFNPDQMFDPYVGAGVNYTHMLDKNVKFTRGALAGNKIKIENDSWGYALQAGLDINLKDGWLLNADVKYVTVDTDVKANIPGLGWRKVDSLDIDPWVFGLGIGKKF